jgi:tRNA G37 N-methylase Trm5
MPQYVKSGDSYRISYITGPKHILLGLILAEESASDVAITSLGTTGTCNHGTLNLERIKDRVIEGVAKANESFGTTFKVKEIEYVENDTPDYNLYAYCAFLLIKGLHEGVEFMAPNEK